MRREEARQHFMGQVPEDGSEVPYQQVYDNLKDMKLGMALEQVHVLRRSGEIEARVEIVDGKPALFIKRPGVTSEGGAG